MTLEDREVARKLEAEYRDGADETDNDLIRNSNLDSASRLAAIKHNINVNPDMRDRTLYRKPNIHSVKMSGSLPNNRNFSYRPVTEDRMFGLWDTVRSAFGQNRTDRALNNQGKYDKHVQGFNEWYANNQDLDPETAYTTYLNSQGIRPEYHDQYLQNFMKNYGTDPNTGQFVRNNNAYQAVDSNYLDNQAQTPQQPSQVKPIAGNTPKNEYREGLNKFMNSSEAAGLDKRTARDYYNNYLNSGFKDAYDYQYAQNNDGRSYAQDYKDQLLAQQINRNIDWKNNMSEYNKTISGIEGNDNYKDANGKFDINKLDEATRKTYEQAKFGQQRVAQEMHRAGYDNSNNTKIRQSAIADRLQKNVDDLTAKKNDLTTKNTALTDQMNKLKANLDAFNKDPNNASLLGTDANGKAYTKESLNKAIENLNTQINANKTQLTNYDTQLTNNQNRLTRVNGMTNVQSNQNASPDKNLMINDDKGFRAVTGRQAQTNLDLATQEYRNAQEKYKTELQKAKDEGLNMNKWKNTKGKEYEKAEKQAEKNKDRVSNNSNIRDKVNFGHGQNLARAVADVKDAYANNQAEGYYDYGNPYASNNRTPQQIRADAARQLGFSNTSIDSITKYFNRRDEDDPREYSNEGHHSWMSQRYTYNDPDRAKDEAKEEVLKYAGIAGGSLAGLAALYNLLGD